MSANLAIIASIVTAVSGLLLAYAGMKKAEREGKSQGEDTCKDELAKARKEAEDLATELHDYRMKELKSNS